MLTQFCKCQKKKKMKIWFHWEKSSLNYWFKWYCYSGRQASYGKKWRPLLNVHPVLLIGLFSSTCMWQRVNEKKMRATEFLFSNTYIEAKQPAVPESRPLIFAKWCPRATTSIQGKHQWSWFWSWISTHCSINMLL